MKKTIIFIAIALISISVASAQTLRMTTSETAPKKELLRTNEKLFMQIKAQPAELSVVSKANFDGISALKAPAALTAKYQRPLGTMYVGFESDLGACVPIIVGKSNVDWVFQNKSLDATSYEWTMNSSSEGLTVAPNGDMTFNPRDINLYYMPEIVAKNGSSTQSWYYGSGTNDQISFLDASSNTWPMTNAERHYGGYYTGFSDGYGFGTDEIQGENVTGVLTYYNKPQAPLLIQEIMAMLYSHGTTPLSNNGKLTMTVYKVNDKGEISEEVASSDLYKDELLNPKQGVWYTPFHFTEYDEITGLVTEINLLIDYPFAIELTWDDSNADFGVYMARNTYQAGSAYATTDQGHAYRFGEWNADRTVFFNLYDVFFMLNGTYPTFEISEPTQKVTVPNEGGLASFTYQGSAYNNIIIQSTFTSEDIEIAFKPDWVDFEAFEDVKEIEEGEEYFTNTIYAYFSGKALPSDLTGRAGNIVLNLYGNPVTIQVKQGDADWVSGISSVKAGEAVKVARSGDNFVLSYPTTATSVSVYNIAGQQVGNYKLNFNGTQTLSASDWAKGVYILKFNGSNSTVKVIK